jgi:LEA14-like dessication related protein
MVLDSCRDIVGGTLRGVNGRGIVERAGTKEIVTLATRMGWRTTRQAYETKLTREERRMIERE